jgi:hypothetical protein
MTNRINRIISYLIPLFFLPLSSCFLWEKPIFPQEPVLDPVVEDLKEVVFDTLAQTLTDFVRLRIKFTDGDGDLGFSPQDTTAPSPFQTTINGQVNPNSFNFLAEGFQLKNGEWLPLTSITNPDVIPGAYNGRFMPRFQDGDKVGPIEGILIHKLGFLQTEYAPNTIVKFRIKIRDRNLNTSNEVETDTIRLNAR